MLSGFPFLETEADEANARRLIMVRGLAAYPALLDRLNRPDSSANWLPELIEAQSDERAICAVPYFWFHLKQSINALAGTTPDGTLDSALDGVAFAALDSFAGDTTGFPTGCFPLPATPGVQLMRLGLTFGEQLRPQSAKALYGGLIINVSGGALRLYTAVEPPRAFREMPVRRIESRLVDLGSSVERLEDNDNAIKKVTADCRRAAEWIAHASPTCARLIAEEIQFLVPLRHGGSFHYSFTKKQLPGLLFIGGSNRLLTIIEALIHEAGHSRLHRASEVYPLVPNGQKDSLYSPWRDDPRPPSGVLHGFYVFALVLLFWSDVLEAGRGQLSDSEEQFLRKRVALLAVQLREAVSVLDQATLSPFAVSVLKKVRDELPDYDELPVSAAEIAAANECSALKRSRAFAEHPGLVMPQTTNPDSGFRRTPLAFGA